MSGDPWGANPASARDMGKAPPDPVDRRQHLVAARHGKGAARAEIVLHVDGKEEIGVAGHSAVSPARWTPCQIVIRSIFVERDSARRAAGEGAGPAKTRQGDGSGRKLALVQRTIGRRSYG
jgi:hypothetical protein